MAATNVDLLRLVREGKFREDLYYRLSAFPIAIPPLAERRDDIRKLAVHFLKQFAGSEPVPALPDEAAAWLETQAWPGNVRELQNVMELAFILANGEAAIRPAHLMLREWNNQVRDTGDRTSSSGAALRAFSVCSWLHGASSRTLKCRLRSKPSGARVTARSATGS